MPSPRLICHWLSFFNHRIWLRSYGFNLFFLTKESKDNPSYTVNQFSMNSLLWNFYFSFFNFISLFCDAVFLSERMSHLHVQEHSYFSYPWNSLFFVLFYKIKSKTTKWSSNPTSECIPKRVETRVSERCLCLCVHHSVICNSQDRETAQMPVSDE